MWRYVACGLALALMLTACSTAPAPEPTPVEPTATVLVAASPALATDGRLAIVWEGTRDPEPPSAALKPAAGRRFVSIDVTIASVTSGEIEYNALYLRARTDQTREYSLLMAGQLPDFLRAGKLSSGEERRGTVVYEIADGEHITALAYTLPQGEVILVKR